MSSKLPVEIQCDPNDPWPPVSWPTQQKSSGSQSIFESFRSHHHHRLEEICLHLHQDVGAQQVVKTLSLFPKPWSPPTRPSQSMATSPPPSSSPPSIVWSAAFYSSQSLFSDGAPPSLCFPNPSSLCHPDRRTQIESRWSTRSSLRPRETSSSPLQGSHPPGLASGWLSCLWR